MPRPLRPAPMATAAAGQTVVPKTLKAQRNKRIENNPTYYIYPNMKTNLFLLSLLFLLCTSVLCGCANDDEQILSTDGSTLTVHATANGFASADGVNTRASESGYNTTFTKGDQIGVFAVKDGRVIEDCKNVPLTYNGTGWEGTVYYYTGAKYFAYYPYVASMSDKTSVEEIVDAFTPQSDQSTNENYTKSDLMTADVVSPSDKRLNFQFEHKMSLIEISLPLQKYITPAPEKYEYSSPVIGATFSIDPGSGQQSITPYKMGGGVYRYIVPAKVSHTVGGEFQTGDGKTIAYSKAGFSLSAGNYKRLNVSYDGAPSGEPQERAIAIGDYYYSDGSICPGNASNPPSEDCIGIVFSTDVNRIGQVATEALGKKGVTTPHGLVMALTNASDGCNWCKIYRDENAGGADGAPFKDNTVNLKKQYHNVDGYAETHWIIETYKNDGSILKDIYSAFYHASLYGTAKGGTAKYAVPTNTTGWFIPSMGQWWDILSNLGKVNLDSYKNSEDPHVYIYDAATTAVNNMNDYLNKITDADTFSTDDSFWSSSEYNSLSACGVSFNRTRILVLRPTGKIQTRMSRCVLAF